MENDFLKISNNSDQNSLRTKFYLQDFVQEKMQYPQSYSQNEKLQISDGNTDNQKDFSNNKQFKNSNSNSIHTQSSLQTKDCIIQQFLKSYFDIFIDKKGTTPLVKSDYDFEQSRIFLRDYQLLDSSPFLMAQKDKFSMSNQNLSSKQALQHYNKEDNYIPFKSQEKTLSSDRYSKHDQQQVGVNEFFYEKDGKISQQIDLKLKKYHSQQTIRKPTFNFNQIENLLKVNQSNVEEDTNLQILMQYQNQIKQLQQESNLERKKYQNEVDNLLKSNRDLQRKLTLQNQEYQIFPQKQNDLNNFSFKQYETISQKQHENFSFANNLNKFGDQNLPNNADDLKKMVLDLKYENKELQLKVETLIQELNNNKYQFECSLENKVAQFEKQKKGLKHKCKLILQQMSGMKNELTLLKDKTIELKEKNQNQLSKLDFQAFKSYYDNSIQSQQINQQYYSTTIQQLTWQLQEKDQHFEKYKIEISRQISEKNTQIEQLQQKVEQLELQQSEDKLNFNTQTQKNNNSNLEFTQNQIQVDYSNNLQAQLFESLHTQFSQVQYTQRQINKNERSQSNFIKQFKHGNNLEEQMKSIQIENMQKYLNLEQKYSKMNAYYSDRVLQSDSQIQLKEQKILQKDLQIQEKEKQIIDYQDILQLKEEKQRVNKNKQIQIQKSLEGFLNDKSNQHLEYKRASSQELLRLKKELSQANFEKRKQSGIIEELLSIKETQKKEIQNLKKESINISCNSSLNRQYSLQNNHQNPNSSDIIRENFSKNDSKKAPSSLSERACGKKQTELSDIMKQISSYSTSQFNKNKGNQSNHYVVVSGSNTKNQDYFIDKKLKQSQKSTKKTSEETMQELKPKKLTFFDHKDNNLSKMINDLDWSKFLQSQSNQFQVGSMKQQMNGIQGGQNDTSLKDKQRIENKNDEL